VKDRVDRDEALARLGAALVQRQGEGRGAECPGADLVAGYLDRTLDAREREQCEEHFAACARCQQVLADFARSETLAPQVEPVRQRAGVWGLLRWQWLAPAAAVLTVGVVWAIVRPAFDRTAPPLAQLSAPAAESPVAHAAGAAAAENEARLDEDRAARAERREAAPRSQEAQPTGVHAQIEQSATESRATRGKSATSTAPAPAVARNLPAEPAKDTRVDAIQMQKATESARPAAAPAAAERALVEQQLGVARTGAARVMATAEGALLAAVVVSPVPAVAWRIGMGGSIERSVDGRRTWQKQDSGVTANLLAGIAPSETVCWVVGQRGTVLRTVDGRTWGIVGAPAAVDLVEVTARDAMIATVVGADGRKFSTMDGGRTWQSP
jgi:hypothetical protein